MNIDETVRRQASAESLALYQLNRELLAISTCKKTLLRAEDEQTLLSDICRIICSDAGYRLAWVGYVENLPAKAIRIVARAGVDEGYLDQAGLTWDDSDHGRGPAGMASKTGKSVCIQDFESDPRVLPWRDSALQRGYRSALALPLKEENHKVFGVLAIYSTIPDNFTPEECRLLHDLADDLVFGILTLRTRQANELAKKQIALQSFALDSVREAAFLIDEQARLHYANQALCRMLDIPHEELLQLQLPDIIADLPMELWRAHWRTLRQKRSVSIEACLKNRNGDLFPVEMTSYYLIHDDQEFNLTLLRDTAERKKVEQERIANLQYFRSMDLVNKAIQRDSDLDRMIRDVLDLVLSIFASDRAYLLYPCDPEAESWSVVLERCRPNYPVVRAQGEVIPMTEEMAVSFRTSLLAGGPVQSGQGTGISMPPAAAARYAVKNAMSMVIRPKVGRPWRFGIHQCSHARTWPPEEVKLFEAISRRLGDGLDVLLTLRDLKKSEGRYRQLMKTAYEGILVLDEDNSPTFLNPRLAEILGYSSEELRDMPVVSLLFEEDLADHRQKAVNRRQGYAENYERRLRHKNGQEIWARISVSPIMDERGRFNGSFAMFTDITEKKLAEENLLRLNEELEQRVRRRTSELEKSHTELEKAYHDLQRAHVRLLHQEKMAAIGQLAAGLAHEINTPAQFVRGNFGFLRESFENLLQAIASCQDMLDKTEEPESLQTVRETLNRALEEADFGYMREEVFEALDECHDGLDRIANIVTMMKDFAYSGSGELQPVDLEPLIRSTVEISRNQWSKVAVLTTELDPALPSVCAIRNELGVALLNLIANATHAIGDGRCVSDEQGFIRIRSRRTNNWAEILVEDNGCGIPEELQQKIFNPFFTTRETGKGSGQGLTIAHNIITGQHHGELLVESETGRGSIFTIRLPIKVAKETRPAN